MVAKRAAVSAHIGAKAADFMLAGGIEQARQDSQHCGHEIHQTPSVCRNAVTSGQILLQLVDSGNAGM